MPTYDYYCPANDRTVEVFHGFSHKLSSWGELAHAAGIEVDGKTPADAPVERLIGGGTFLQKASGAAPQRKKTPC